MQIESSQKASEIGMRLQSSILKDEEILHLTKFEIVQVYELRLKEKIDEIIALSEQVQILKNNYKELINRK